MDCLKKVKQKLIVNLKVKRQFYEPLSLASAKVRQKSVPTNF
jgi:hypothetical protein